MLKRFLLIIYLLLLLLLGLIPLLASQLDGNDFKADIASHLSQVLGRKVSIAGDVGLTIYPWLGLRMDSVTVDQASGWEAEPFASVERVKVRIKVLPLLTRRIVLDRVDLYRPAVNFHLNKENAGNWEDLRFDRGASLQDEPTGWFWLGAVSWGGVSVKEGTFTYRDDTVDETLVISRIFLDTGPGLDFKFDLRCFVDSELLGLEADATLEGKAKVDLAEDSLRLHQNLLHAKGFFTVAGFPVQSELKGVVDYDVLAGSLDMGHGVLATPGGDANLSIHGRRMYWREMAYSGNATVTAFRPAYWLGDDTPPRILEAFSTLRGNTAYRISEFDLSLPDFALNIRETPVAGRFDIPSYEQSDYRFVLRTGPLDLGGLWPRDESEQGLPEWLFSDTRIDLALDAGNFTCRGVPGEGLSLALLTGNGTVHAAARAERFAEGGGQGSVDVTKEEGAPLAQAALQFNGASAQDLSSLFFSGAYASGKADVAVNASGSCKSVQDLAATLAARGRIVLDGGAVALPRLSKAELKWSNSTLIEVRRAEAGFTLAGPGASWKKEGAVPLKAAAELSVAARQGGQTGMDVAGRVVWDPAGRRVLRLEEARVNATQSGRAGDYDVRKAFVNAVADVDLEHRSAVFRNAAAAVQAKPSAAGAKLEEADLQYAGTVRYALEQSQLTADDGKLRLEARFREGAGRWRRISAEMSGQAAVSLEGKTAVIPQARIEAEAEPVKPLWGRDRLEGVATGGLEANWGKESLVLKQARANAYGVNATGETVVMRFLSAPTVSGMLRIEPFSLRDALREWGVEPPVTADSAALTQCALETSFGFTADNAHLDGLVARLDDTEISGGIVVSDFTFPTVRLGLKADALNADRYRPPPRPKGAPPERPPDPSEEWDISLLRTMDIEGSVGLDTLVLHKLTYGQVHADIRGKDGVIRVGPLNSSFYEGSCSGDITLKAGKMLSCDSDLAYRGYQMEPVMRALFKEDEGYESIAGQADLNLLISGEGLSWYALSRSFQGKALFHMNGGSYRFFGANSKGRQSAGSDEDNSGAPKSGAVSRTEFDSADATLTLRDGVVANEDFRLRGLVVNAEGQGYCSLRNNRVDYTINFRMAGIPTVPIHIHGNLDDPSVDVSAVGILPKTLVRIPGSALGLVKSILSLPFHTLEMLGRAGSKSP